MRRGVPEADHVAEVRPQLTAATSVQFPRVSVQSHDADGSTNGSTEIVMVGGGGEGSGGEGGGGKGGGGEGGGGYEGGSTG